MSRGTVAAFAKEWMTEDDQGGTNYHKLHSADVDTPFEKAGRSVRDLMPWLGGRGT